MKVIIAGDLGDVYIVVEGEGSAEVAAVEYSKALNKLKELGVKPQVKKDKEEK